MTTTSRSKPAPATGHLPGDGRSFHLRWYVAAAFTVLLALHCARPTGAVGDATFLTVSLGAGVAAWAGVALRPRHRRRPWAFIAAGVTSGALGDLLFGLQSLDGVAPQASLSDLFWLAGCALLGVGLLALLVRRTSHRCFDIDGLIDLGSYTVVSLIVVSQVVGLDKIFADPATSMTEQLTYAAYPILEATLLALLVRSMLSGRLRGSGGLLLSLGIACSLGSDFAILLLGERSDRNGWVDLGWLAAASLLALSAWPVRRPAAPVEIVPPVTGARVLAGLAPLLLPGLIDLFANLRGDDTNPAPWFVASAVLVLLAFLRAKRLVTLRDRQQSALETGRRYYHALAHNSADAVVIIGDDGRIVNDTPHLAEMLGRPGGFTAGSNAVQMLDPVDHERATTRIAQMRSAVGVLQTELRMRHSDGSDRWFTARSVNLADDPAIRGLVLNLHDVTARRHAENELSHRAFHDSVTGLANRALFHDRVEHALQRTGRTGADVAVAYLDVDGFKTVNDSCGHEAGDDVLREIACRVQTAVRTADTVARLGGDEFAILIEGSAHPLQEAGTVADRILQAMVEPIQLGDQQTVLSASIGITVSGPESTASSMLRDADVAMYRAKTSGKSRWTVYDPQMRAAAVERLALETDLVTALANHEFRLVYQPVVELDTGHLAGFEALLRWHHPTRGIVGPDAFIPITEENGTIVEVGRWVLFEACRTAAAWQRLRPQRKLTMAVNLSGRQIATPEIVSHVIEALARSGFPADQLILELTESVLVEDTATAARRLHELHALDVRLAVDDFGTGYSSLSYLRQFPVDILKVDRSFTSTITQRHQVPAIVRGLLHLGQTLQLELIAEGIETAVQRDALRDCLCQYGQGFLFAKPLGPDEAAELVTRASLGQVDTPLGPIQPAVAASSAAPRTTADAARLI